MTKFHKLLNAAAGDGGEAAPGGLLAGQAAKDAIPAATPVADLRTYLSSYVADPRALEAMPEPDLRSYHDRVRSTNDKAVAEALTKSAGKLEKRPDFVPEQFWDEKEKRVNLDAAFKSLSDTRQELKKVKGEPPKGIPKDPAGYEWKAPADIPPHIASGDDDDSLKIMRAVAHKAGLTQEQFATLTEGYLRMSAEIIPPPMDEKAELAKLGPNGPKLLETVHGWGKGLVASGTLSKAEFEEVFIMGSTAAGVRALNKIRESMGGQPIPSTSISGEALPSAQEAYALVGTQKYRTDPAERARVSKIFEQIFGTAPSQTGSSPQIPV